MSEVYEVLADGSKWNVAEYETQEEALIEAYERLQWYRRGMVWTPKKVWVDGQVVKGDLYERAADLYALAQ